MTRIHLIYPHGPEISCPDAIGRRLGAYLREAGYEILLYDWDDNNIIHPMKGDILLGHPHPHPWTIFRRSSRIPGWARILMISPYAHGNIYQISHLDRVVRRADQYLAITGKYWFESVSWSPYAHWLPKMVHLDLAVDRNDFPRIKREFNPPGRRRFLYIGNQAWVKNTSYLSRLAARLPDCEFAWIGGGPAIRGLHPLGFQDFSQDSARGIVGPYDFLLNVSSSDANPTTILEAMSWGLIPVCTAQSGYHRQHGIVNVPLDDEEGAVQILRSLQSADEHLLHDWQSANDHALDSHYNWGRFCGQVLDAVQSSACPSLLPESISTRLQLLAGEIWSPWSFVRRAMSRTRTAVLGHFH